MSASKARIRAQPQNRKRKARRNHCDGFSPFIRERNPALNPPVDVLLVFTGQNHVTWLQLAARLLAKWELAFLSRRDGRRLVDAIGMATR